MDKDKALEAAVTQIERQFGKGSVMRLGDHPVSDDMQFVPTGSLALDIALGVGGIPRGRIIEIYGPESSGKTTMVYHLIAQAQKLGGQAAFIDAEHAMDPIYAKAIGVDVDNLLVSQPDYGEQALEIAEMLVRSGALDIVAIDSVAALTPKAEIEGEMGDSFVGLQARLMSQALRKLNGSLSRSGTICAFTNQLREKIGVMFGNPEVTTGGKALKFYATIRLDIRRIETLKDGTEAVGNRVRVKVVKNKVAPPFKQAEFDITYGKGISREGSLLDLGVFYDVVAKSGAFFSYNDERLGQGRANAKVFLAENPDIADAIEVQIRAKAGLPASAALAEATADARRRGGYGGGRSARGRRPRHRRGPAGLMTAPAEPVAERLRSPAVPVVTALRATRRGGVALHVDEEYVCVVSESLVARWRLFKGRELSADDVAEIRAASSAERVMGDAYRLLGHRARSREELRQRLLAKEHDEARRGRGPGAAGRRRLPRRRRVRAQLRRGQAPPRRLGRRAHPSRTARAGRRRCVSSTRRSAAKAGGGRGDELDRALALLRKRGAPEQPLDAARRRAFQALQRRGFSTSIAYAAVRLWVGRSRVRSRIDSASRHHVPSAHATCARALCIPLSLLHGDTDGGPGAEQAENESTRGPR